MLSMVEPHLALLPNIDILEGWWEDWELISLPISSSQSWSLREAQPGMRLHEAATKSFINNGQNGLSQCTKGRL